MSSQLTVIYFTQLVSNVSINKSIDIGVDTVGVLLDLSMSYGASDLLLSRLLATVTGLVWLLINYAYDLRDRFFCFIIGAMFGFQNDSWPPFNPEDRFSFNYDVTFRTYQVGTNYFCHSFKRLIVINLEQVCATLQVVKTTLIQNLICTSYHDYISHCCVLAIVYHVCEPAISFFHS